MIRTEAGMPTARFCQLFGVPGRTWRRWQARARAQARGKGPWPRPVRHGPAREAVIGHALAHPAWGHRKVWAMARHDGHEVSAATVLRLLRDEGLILPAAYQRERRKLAERRKAAFAVEPTGPNQVWQLDFTEFETTSGGTWRLAGCRWSAPVVRSVRCVSRRFPVGVCSFERSPPGSGSPAPSAACRGCTRASSRR